MKYERKSRRIPKPEVDWVEVEDDGCRWILDLPGGPFAVLPCDVDNTPVEIFSDTKLAHHQVKCPKCGKHTPDVISRSLRTP